MQADLNNRPYGENESECPVRLTIWIGTRLLESTQSILRNLKTESGRWMFIIRLMSILPMLH